MKHRGGECTVCVFVGVRNFHMTEHETASIDCGCDLCNDLTGNRKSLFPI